MNTDGAVVESYDYYPFGLKMPGRIYPATPTITKTLFTGKERDSETSWDYFGARYYHSALGRWLAVDPWGKNYPSLSSFVYSENNPLRFIDTNGMYLYDASTSKRIAASKAFQLLKKGIRARYEGNPEKSYIGFYEKADFFDWFDPGWKRSASIMHGSTIEFTKDVIGELSAVNVTVSPTVSSLISEIAVFKDKSNSNKSVEILIINIYNDQGRQIAHISGKKEQIKKFLSEFGRDLKTRNVLSYKDEEKWKKLEEWDLEGLKEEKKESGDTGYEAKYGSPQR